MNIKSELINKTNFVYIDDYGTYLNEYYQYIIKCFRHSLNILDVEKNILIGNFQKTTYQDLKVDANVEHTLVKQGGRSTNGAPTGKIQYGNNFYLCRVDNLQYLNTLDIIIEYSMPNVKNITTSGYYPYLLDKIIYISPIIFDINDFQISKRSKTITMFINTEEYRRKIFLDNVSKKNIDCINYQNIYNKEDLINFYSDVKIMVNIHQTPHHDTFEELRVLGALINGIIIISEDVPLKEEIPYSEYIIWCTYDTVYDTIKDVQENYENYWTKIFSNGKLKDLLLKMEQNNFNNIKKHFSI